MSTNISGPYYSKDKPKLAAYILSDNISNFRFTVCFVISDDESQRKIIEQNYCLLFNFVINYAYEQYKDYSRVPLYICHFQTVDDNDTKLYIYPSQIVENEAERIAQRVLTDVKTIENKLYNDKSYTVTNYGKIDGTELYDTTITRDDWNYEIPVKTKAPEDIQLFAEIIEEADQLSLEMFLEEVITFIKEDNPEEAFHSFSHYAEELGEDLSTLEVLDIALALANLLIIHGFHDYADWTANWAYSIALKYGRYEQALDALRWCGIANEGLFKINELKASYEKAINLVGKVTNQKKIAQLYMSYGISLIVIAFYLEVDGSHNLQNSDCVELDVFNLAQNYLEKANSIFKGIKKFTNKFNLKSIELDLIHIEDLRGNHLEALAELENLIRKDKTIKKDPRLSTTALIYTIASIRHLYKKDSEWEEKYFTYLQSAAEIVPYISSKIPDKACYICIWIGDELSKLGNVEASVDYYFIAYNIQQFYKQNQIGSANPGTKYGGILAIDIAGRIQKSILNQPNSEGYPQLIIKSFDICESEKGKFFRRDMLLGINNDKHDLVGRLKSKNKFLRQAFYKTTIDQRLLMSDYKWFLKWDASETERSKLKSFDEFFNMPLSADRLKQLLYNEKPNTAIASFYITDNETLVYIFRYPYKNILTLKLDIDSAKLARISQALHVGIYGSEYNYKLLFDFPEKNNKFFKPLFALNDLLRPLVNELSNLDLIYICPHGLWHSIPIHMLLLTELWKKGDIPAIVYIPSVHLFELLHERYSSNYVFQHRKYGLTTAFTNSDPEAPFQNTHKIINDIFQHSNAGVIDSFGKKATTNKALEIMNEVSLYHIIAHGSFQEGENAMNSGLLLSNSSELPCRNQAPNITGNMIMINGTTASHVTLQACSLGKRLVDQGNEFWGVVRALILAGANTVVAPLWDTDIYSSTKLFELFYSNWILDKQPKWKAWANAQYSMFSQPEEASWSHFTHWAAFQFIGYCGIE